MQTNDMRYLNDKKQNAGALKMKTENEKDREIGPGLAAIDYKALQLQIVLFVLILFGQRYTQSREIHVNEGRPNGC